MESPRTDSDKLFLSSVLIDLIDEQNLSFIEFFLKCNDVDTNIIVPEYRLSPIHFIVGHDDEKFAVEVLKLFLQNGGDPNTISHDGMTPVHIATILGKIKILKLLIKAGGDIFLRDTDGISALEYAKHEGFYDILYYMTKDFETSSLITVDENVENYKEHEKTDIENDVKTNDCLGDFRPSSIQIHKRVSLVFHLQNPLSPISEETASHYVQKWVEEIPITVDKNEPFIEINKNSEFLYKVSDNIQNRTNNENELENPTSVITKIKNILGKYRRTSISIIEERSSKVNSNESSQSYVTCNELSSHEESNLMKIPIKSHQAEFKKNIPSIVIQNCETLITSDENNDSESNSTPINTNTNAKNKLMFNARLNISPSTENVDILTEDYSSGSSDIPNINYFPSNVPNDCLLSDLADEKISFITSDQSLMSLKPEKKSSNKDILNKIYPPSNKKQNCLISNVENEKISFITSDQSSMFLKPDEKSLNIDRLNKIYPPSNKKHKYSYSNVEDETISFNTSDQKIYSSSSNNTEKEESGLNDPRHNLSFCIPKERCDINSLYSKNSLSSFNSSSIQLNDQATKPKLYSTPFNSTESINDNENIDSKYSPSLLQADDYLNTYSGKTNSMIEQNESTRNNNLLHPNRNQNLTSSTKSSTNYILPHYTEYIHLNRNSQERTSSETGRTYACSMIEQNESTQNNNLLHSNRNQNLTSSTKSSTHYILPHYTEYIHLNRNSQERTLSETGRTYILDTDSEKLNSLDKNLYKSESEDEISSFNKNMNKNEKVIGISEEYMYTDTENDIVILERIATPIGRPNSVNSVSTLSDKFPLPQNDDCDTDTLKQELTALGVQVGPITKTTKRVYIKKLYHMCSDKELKIPALLKKDKIFSVELEKTLRDLNWTKDLSKYLQLEKKLTDYFNTANPKRPWRGGTAKSSFTYLLLDPRITKNLPLRYDSLSNAEIWKTFVSAIFYVGKGKRSRPYNHLYDAIGFWNKGILSTSNTKIQYILNIWLEQSGVVCLHMFQNTLAVEAFTREAAMIDAIEVKNLKNNKRGEYYGIASSWSCKEKRMLGVYLLYKAMLIFLNEGERQLRPGDID